jgi:acetyl esterase/lipase
VPLLDAERAVRYVRTHAAEWGIDPERIGVAGQSAGANLVLNLASRFDAGDAKAGDLIERASSRPDFMVVLTSWNFGKPVSTFTFPADTPPVFLRHAKNDAGFTIAEQVVARLQEQRVPLDYLFLETGGHGAFELSPENPGAGWPDDLVAWLRQRGLFGRAQP